VQKEGLRQIGNICIIYLGNTQVPPYEKSMVQQEVMLIRTQGCVNWYYDWRFWYQHVNCCYTSAAACCSSFIASWSAFKTNGIKYLFVAIMPLSRSRRLPLEKSKSFPEASFTKPPASANIRKGYNKKTNHLIVQLIILFVELLPVTTTDPAA
jgi:hypothetical protein